VDIFACSLDQVGLAEMKVCAENTGGLVVLAESFAHTVFKTSFARMFASEGTEALGVSSGGVFEVITSRDVKVRRCRLTLRNPR
jgi:protein transport protein SEC23